MNTIKNNNVYFNARNPKIRFADDIARNVNRVFPRISPTKVETFNKASWYEEDLLEELWGKLLLLRIELRTMKDLSLLSDKINFLFDSIKKHRIGNCGEAADLALIAAKTNGIENCIRAHLETPRGESFDHAVVLINDEKPYIIDAWLGFADYIPNAIKKYQTIFRNCFDFNDMGEKIVIKEVENIFNEDFSIEELKKIQKAHPKIILKRCLKK